MDRGAGSSPETLNPTEPRRRRRISWVWAALAVGVVALAIALGRCATEARDPVATLRAQLAPVSSVLREPLTDGNELWRISTGRDTLLGLWRPAPASTRSPWTIVLLGGLHTGERAALTLPAATPVNVLAMDWPWRGPRRMSNAEFLRQVPAIRRALMRTPAVLVAGVDAVAHAHRLEPRDVVVDSTRVALVGVSLGVPPALAAARWAEGVSALVLIDGGADFERVLRRDLEGLVEPRWIAPPLARAGAWAVAPLEPEHHAEAVSHLRVLLVNARRDERLPAECIARLHQLLPRAAAIWREDVHVGPHRAGAIAALVRDGLAWLEAGSP